MPGAPKVPRGMFVLGRVATADVTAFHAHSQLKPGVAAPQALGAAGAARPDIVNVREVRADQG